MGDLERAALASAPFPERLGKYEVLQRLAIGGMAEIFLARSSGIEGFEKYVVIKRMLPKYVGNERFVTMFLDEARLAGRLQHQNIAQVYDIGQQDGQYFFAMEFLHGEDLRSLLATIAKRDQKIPLATALTIVAGTAAGLHHAHEEVTATGAALNIVHRDISPSNIIVTFGGGVKVVDFGIARAEVRDTHTRAGALKGKRPYMSPEQCTAGAKVDRRSDVFSLGVVLWEMTTMSRLFRRHRHDNDIEIMDRIVKGDITPPRAMVRDYPEPLERVVMQALATDREARYPTCKAFLDELEEVAARLQLRLSSSALAEYVESVFGKRPKPWRSGSQLAIDPTEVLEQTISSVDGTDSEDTTDVQAVTARKYTPVWPRVPAPSTEEDEDAFGELAAATVQMRPDELPDEVQEALPTFQFHPDEHPDVARRLREAYAQRLAELTAEKEAAEFAARNAAYQSSPDNQIISRPDIEVARPAETSRSWFPLVLAGVVVALAVAIVAVIATS